MKRQSLRNPVAAMGGMVRILLNRVHAVAGIDSETDYDRAILRERFAALKNQLPWLYAIMIVNIAGIQLVVRRTWLASLLPAAIILAVIAVRSVHLRRLDPETMPSDRVRLELLRTFLIANACFAINIFWILGLYVRLDWESRVHVAVLAGLAATGASCGLSGFPAAARIPLLFIALPCGFVLVASNSIGHAGIGLSLVVLALISMRMITVVDGNFKRLVMSRFTIDVERRRAVEAEQSALREKRQITRLANTDALTGVANRRGFLTRLNAYCQDEWRKLGLILLDLDGFKSINDTFGHADGDALLIAVARRLQALAIWQMPVARLGGDEFALVCECGDVQQGIRAAERAVAALGRPFLIEGRDMRISACAGVSFRGGEDVNEALRRADIALFAAKRRGRGSVSPFSNVLEQEVRRRTAIEQALRQPGFAAATELRFQPIFDLKTMELRSFEALARWHDPQLGFVSPAEFIPISEQISVVQEISDQLLRRAAEAARTWPETVRLSFNLSPVQLCSTDMAINVLDVIRQTGLDPSRLQIEVTETAIMADFEVARQNLSCLRESGVGIALDDFGAGYSSISYLRQMNFDVVKLDGSLIGSLEDSGPGLPLLIGVLALCNSMGQHCIAEHIEDERQLTLLRELGCRYGQGFALSRPLDFAGAQALAASRTKAFRRGRHLAAVGTGIF